ncbi:MAG: four helix bundle protein [Flavisolibacter sp.]|nr:four helix bundle protein [Flavisolibacter sp.]
MSFNEKYSKRTKELALQVIRLSSTANHKNMAVNILLRQVLRSATSVAANFRAVCRS